MRASPGLRQPRGAAVIPFDEIERIGLTNLPRLLKQWFPLGRWDGHEFVIGDIDGNPGQSFKVNSRTGKFAEFNGGGIQGKGVINLCAAKFHHGDRIVAARDLGLQLGVYMNGSSATGPAPNSKSQPKPAGNWEPLVPPPAGTPPPSDLDLRCDAPHEYVGPTDETLFYVRRFEARNGKRKHFVPLTFGILNGKRGWHPRHPASPRPLYGQNRLATMPSAPVIVCEGEKSADAAQELFPDHACITWPGGTNAVGSTDWTPLNGRQNVIIWPDNDAPGLKAAAEIVTRLPLARVLRVDDLPHGADAADVDVGDDPEAWLRERLPPLQQEPQNPPKLQPRPWLYRDPTAIPPREWLIGTTLLRGYATVLGSTGGVGKTAYAISMALAFITGRRDILDEHIFQTGSVWFLTLEDDADELDRRIDAAIIAHGISPEEIKDKLFISTAREHPVRLATLDEGGGFKIGEDAQSLEDGIKEIVGTVLVIIDPLAKSHAVTENSNEHMDRFIALLNDLSMRTKSATLVPCHFRKGGSEDGGRDAIRGGSALIDGARIAKTLTPMTAKEAEFFGIHQDCASRYVRINDAKANMALRQAARWTELVSISLGNGGLHEAYPNGDSVQAARPWEPPSAFDGLDHAALGVIFGRLREGPGGGWRYSPHKKAQKRWAGLAITEVTKRPDEQAATILDRWKANGVWRVASYQTPDRKPADCIELDESKVRAMRDGVPRCPDDG
jgi:AAA domain